LAEKFQKMPFFGQIFPFFAKKIFSGGAWGVKA
jgi:hypothetical protein